MSETVKYAVIADEKTVASLLRQPSSSLVAVCLIDGDVAEVHVLKDREGLADLIDGIPVSPSGYSSETAFPSFAAESEAISHISDALSSNFSNPAQALFPDGFSAASPILDNGLSIRMTDYGLDLRITLQLCGTLGWIEGDRLCLGVNHGTNLLAVTRGRPGAALLQTMDDPDMLEIEHDLSGLPLHVDVAPTEWIRPRFRIDNGSLVFLAPASTGKTHMNLEKSDTSDGFVVVPAASRRIARSRLNGLLLTALFACGGFLIGRFCL